MPVVFKQEQFGLGLGMGVRVRVKCLVSLLDLDACRVQTITVRSGIRLKILKIRLPFCAQKKISVPTR